MCEEIEDFDMDPLELFKSDLSNVDNQTHLRALRMLSRVAVALDVERTRHELVPFLEEYLQIHYFGCDDILAIIAEQLGNFAPFIGGYEYAHLLFPMLAKLAACDDTETGEKAVASLKNIANHMTGQQLEEHFIHVIQTLAEAEWFTSKCSAAPLFPVAYTKVSDECKGNLMNMFSNLLQDESPMVRRAAAISLADFVKNAEMDALKSEFIPSFKDLAKDDQDSVRILAVNVGIALAYRLTNEEIEEHIMATLQALCVDSSWRVRYRCAFEINNIQLSIGPKLTRETLVEMYKSLIRDTEANIREISARNIVRFCELLQKSYVESLENGERAEYLNPVIKTEMLPLIKELDQDAAEDVQDGLYSVITSLSSLLGEMDTRDFLVPLITNCIENDSSKVKANIINNLNNILCVIGIDDLSKTVEKLMTDLLNNSNTFWRTRRNLIVTLSHIAKHSKKEYFNEHLKHLYMCLLNDPINGVRRVAPLALPLFAKYFSMTSWGKQSIVEIMLDFVGKNRYLLRLMCLFCIDELIQPTLDKKSGEGYLSKLKCIQDENSSLVLNKIQKLNTILTENLKNEWVGIVLKYCEDESYFNDNIKTYAEDTFETLTNCVEHHIVAVSKEEIENCNEESYLEGILFLSIVYFMDIIRELAQDKVYNVRMRAARTLHCINALNKKLITELEEPWVANVLQILPTEEKERVGAEIQNNLFNAHNQFSEIRKEMIIVEDNIAEVPILEAKDIKEEFEKMELEQKIAESVEISETYEKAVPIITPDVNESETEYFLAKDCGEVHKPAETTTNETQQPQINNSTNSSSAEVATIDKSQAVFISDDIHV